MKKRHFYVLFVLVSILINCKTGNKTANRPFVNDLSVTEKNLDHAGFIRDFDNKALARGEESTMPTASIAMEMKKTKAPSRCP
jgi:hypothetical protein